MKISLIFTSNILNPNFSELSFKDDNIGFIPPLTLLTVASTFERGSGSPAAGYGRRATFL